MFRRRATASFVAFFGGGAKTSIMSKADELLEWANGFKTARERTNMGQALKDSSNEIVVRRKPPRLVHGEPITMNERDPIMIKIRPMVLEAATWKSALNLLKGYAVECGGSVSEKQPPSTGIQRLQGGTRRGPP